MRLFHKRDAVTLSAEGERDQAIGGVTLHLRVWGSPSAGRTALLIPGLTASHKEFLRLAAHLAARDWHVVAPDLRGRGLSSKPAQGYSISVHAADLLGLCDALGLGSVHVVGHSLGAVIGMYLGAIAPHRVARLVLVDAGGNIPEDTAQGIAASVARLGTVYPSLDAFLGLMRQLPMLTWNEDWEEYFRYDAEVRPDGTVVSRVAKAAIEEETVALALARTEMLPNLVRCPTLIARATVGLLGPDRGLVLPREEAERLRGIIAQSQVVEVAETNHYTIMAAPALLDAITTFLAG